MTSVSLNPKNIIPKLVHSPRKLCHKAREERGPTHLKRISEEPTQRVHLDFEGFWWAVSDASAMSITYSHTTLAKPSNLNSVNYPQPTTPFKTVPKAPLNPTPQTLNPKP